MDTQRVSVLAQPSRFRRYAPLWHNMIGFGIALLIAIILFIPAITTIITAPIAAIGFGDLITQLISALCITVGAALLSTMISRQRPGTAIGVGIVYSFCYVLSFFRQEELPHYDFAGHLEVLNGSALVHTIFTLLASGLLCAYLGAIIGKALGEVILDPIWHLARLIWRTRFRSQQIKQQQSGSVEKAPLYDTWKLVSAWVGLLLLLILCLSSTGIVNLLFYSPAVGLYNLPAGAVHGTLISDSMISPSLDGQRRSFLIYLPPSYQDTATPERRYPTLYLLHGTPGSEYDWIEGGDAIQSADALIGLGKVPDLIMVFPDGNGRDGETSEWGNSADGQQLMENFVALDLVHFIDQKYRTLPAAGDRAIGGFSMGAFGAMNIAVHHPDIFGSVISLAGYYTAEGSIWGKNITYRRENSPLLALPVDTQAWKLHIFLGAATEDQTYYADTQKFIQELKVLHINYTFDLENGSHTWSVWEVQLYHALIWLKWQ